MARGVLSESFQKDFLTARIKATRKSVNMFLDQFTSNTTETFSGDDLQLRQAVNTDSYLHGVYNIAGYGAGVTPAHVDLRTLTTADMEEIASAYRYVSFCIKGVTFEVFTVFNEFAYHVGRKAKSQGEFSQALTTAFIYAAQAA